MSLSVRRFILSAVIAAVFISFATDKVLAGDPSTNPFLRLNVGNHTAQINRLATNLDESIVVTASDDKTLGVWNAATGTLEGIMRGPIELGLEGKFYAVAVSPDGESAFAAGQTGSSWDKYYRIYKFDLKKKTVVARAPNIPTVIDDMRFSPDGQVLAVAYGTGGGIDILDGKTLRRIGSDPAYKEMISSLSFNKKGDLAVVSYDGVLRVYEKSMLSAQVIKPTQTVKLSAKRPTSVSFSPKGDKIAVGYDDQQAPDVFSAPRFKLEKSPSIKGIADGTAGTVAWVLGEKGDDELLAAGSLNASPGRNVVRRWHADGSHQDIVVAGNSIRHLVPTADGGYFFASADPSWGRVDRAGNVVYSNQRQILDFRDAHQGRLAISPDGLRVAFQSFEPGAKILKFDLQDRGLATAEQLEDPVPQGNEKATGISVRPRPFDDAKMIKLEDWRNSLFPRLRSKEIKLTPGEYARSVALLPDRKRFVLGAEFSLSLFNLDGGLLRRIDLPAPAWALAASTDGRYVVAALGDGTIRWFNVGDQRSPLDLVVSLFVHPDGKRWVTWTVEGFFDYAKEGGSEMVGFHFNEGAYKTRWMDFENAYRILYSSDLVTAKLEPRNDREIVDRLARIGDLHKVTAEQPRVTLVEYCSLELETRGVRRDNPAPVAAGTACSPVQIQQTRGVKRVAEPAQQPAGQPVAGDAAVAEDIIKTEANRILVRFRIDTLGGVGGVQAFRNGRNASDGRMTRGVSRIKTVEGDVRSQPQVTDAAAGGGQKTGASELHEAIIDLDDGENLIEIRAFDSTGQVYGASAPFQIVREAARDLKVAEKPAPRRLLLLTSGINAYQGDVNPLNYAKTDARSFADIILSGVPVPYDGPESRKLAIQLYDGQAKKNAILEGLTSLREASRPGDIVVIYLAGHGIALPTAEGSAQQGYYYLAASVSKADDVSIRQDGISGQELINALANLRTKDILIIFDTCHAGQFLKSGIDQLRREIGDPNVWAASSSVQEAIDGYKNSGHGLFFYAIATGLTDTQGGVPSDAKGNVHLKDTGRFLTHKVRDLAAEIGWRQKPFIYDARDDEDAEIIPLLTRPH